MFGSVTLDLDPVDRGRSTVGGRLDQEGSTSQGSTGQPSMYARAHYLFMYMLCEVEKSNVRIVCFGVQAVPRGTQVPYSAVVDLAEGYGVSHCQRGELVIFDSKPERTLWKSHCAINFNTTDKTTLVVLDKAKEEDIRDLPLPTPIAKQNEVQSSPSNLSNFVDDDDDDDDDDNDPNSMLIEMYDELKKIPKRTRS
ncbi:hypothetical protein M9H77_06623 [Catharanthus roseus]|uniref:Uncharacterized protein n=1 Tax=Catharanthus roseus TaxID=4058 RepID=A0ACC0BT10_CATRO|nr:hypothetical protein M9H77_06623 [Catharanthus roseus]